MIIEKMLVSGYDVVVLVWDKSKLSMFENNNLMIVE